MVRFNDGSSANALRMSIEPSSSQASQSEIAAARADGSVAAGKRPATPRTASGSSDSSGGSANDRFHDAQAGDNSIWAELGSEAGSSRHAPSEARFDATSATKTSRSPSIYESDRDSLSSASVASAANLSRTSTEQTHPMAPSANGPVRRPGLMSRVTGMLTPRGNFQLAKSVLIGASVLLVLAVMTGNPVIAAIGIGMVAVGVAAWYIGETPHAAARPASGAAPASPSTSAAPSQAGDDLSAMDVDDDKKSLRDEELRRAQDSQFAKESKEHEAASQLSGSSGSSRQDIKNYPFDDEQDPSGKK